MSDRTVKPSVAKDLIKRCIQARRPVFLWGPPGIGKSDIIEQIGKEQDRPVIDIRLILMDPTDIKGIPYYNPTSGKMEWAHPSELPEDDGIFSNALLFFDEMNSAPPSVQGAAYQIILNRRIGEYHLPDGVDIVAAGNRQNDKGITNRMPTPLANRFVHLELRSDFDDWQQWAMEHKVHPDVVGFLSHHKQHLNNFDPKSPDHAFATPRSWVFVSDLLDDSLGKIPESKITDLVAGTVGSGLAIEFNTHRRISAKLPLPEDILTGKEKNLKIKEISAMYSLAVSMSYTLKEWFDAIAEENDKDKKAKLDDAFHTAVDHFFTYSMDNFSTEMIILTAKMALKNYGIRFSHKKVKSFKKFNDEYGPYILGD